MASAAMIMREVLEEAGVPDPRNLAHDLIEKLDAERLIIVARPMPLDSSITRNEHVPAGISEQQMLLLDAIEGNVYAWVQESHIMSRTVVPTERTGDISALEAHGLIECRTHGVRECRMRDSGYACLAAARKAGWEGRAKFVFRRPNKVTPR